MEEARFSFLKSFFSRVLFFVFFLANLSPSPVFAESLLMAPTSGTYAVGDTISVTLFVSTEQSMNAVSGSLVFSSDTLTATNISSSGSIITLWTVQPSYSNTQGTLQFEGVALPSGYQGGSGTLVKVQFRAIAAGTATLRYTGGSLLANDGLGTSLPVGFSSASFVISEKTTTSTPATPSPQPSSLPSAPELSSLTHPDQGLWYAAPQVSLSWPLPAGTQAVRTGVDQDEQGTPANVVSPAVAGITTDVLADGVWFIHVQLKNAAGWGDIATYKVSLDQTVPHDVRVEIPEGTWVSGATVPLVLSAIDEGSGIDHFSVWAHEDAPLDVAYVAEGQTLVDFLLPSSAQSITVRAYDRAGNFADTVYDLTAHLVQEPKLLSLPSEVALDEFIVVQGTAQPGSLVTLTMYQCDGASSLSRVVEANNAGWFAVVWPQLTCAGSYSLTARAAGEHGEDYGISQPLTFVVTAPFSWRIILTSPAVLGVSALLALALSFIAGYATATYRSRRRFVPPRR